MSQLREKLKQFYSTSEPYFQMLDSEEPGYFERYINLIERYSAHSKIVLDLGCGTGLSSYLLSQRKEKVVGLDLSPLFLKKGRERYQADNLLLTAGDILELPFQDETFDLVSSYLVIETLPDIEKGLGEMARVVKRGGIVMVVAANLLSPIWPFRDFIRMLSGGPSRPVWCETPQDAFKTFWRNLSVSVSKWFDRKPRFIPREPDLSCEKVVGRDSEAVYLISPLDVSRFLKQRGFRILRIGSQWSWLAKIFPSFSVRMKVVAQKN